MFSKFILLLPLFIFSKKNNLGKFPMITNFLFIYKLLINYL